MNTKIYLLALALFVINACSTAKVRILPGETINKVVSTDYEKDGAEVEAIKVATEYCEKQNKRVAFVNPEKKSEYTGKTIIGNSMVNDRDYKTEWNFKCL